MTDSRTIFDDGAEQLFREHQQATFRRTDRMFAVLMVLQWLAGMAAALWISPLAWSGTAYKLHVHVWAAVGIGSAVTCLPVCFAVLRPGRALTRHVIAVAQMAMSALLIHLSGGRIETHFHVFGSLAFLACYRDWTVLIPATLAIGLDHLVRGIYWPESVFGVLSASPWRSFEHVVWVLFEDVFLAISITKSVKEMRDIASQQASLEATNAIIEDEVRLRTEQIASTKRELVARSEVLRQSEMQIRAIMQNVGDGIITINEHGVVESLNVAAEELFGYKADEIVGQNISRLMPPPYCHEHSEYLKRYLSTGQSNIIGKQNVLPGLRKDGSIISIELGVSEARLGRRRLFTGILRDITQRQRNEERVATIGRILDESLNEVYIFDAESLKFNFVNRGARHNLGYILEELLEMTPLALTTDFSFDAFQQRIAKLRNGAVECLSFTTSHRRKDGSYYPVEVYLHASTFELRPVFVALVLDITERIESQQKLEQAQAELLQADKLVSVGQLAAGIAHEINTPIQFVGDNVRACSDMFDDLKRVIGEYHALLGELEKDGRFEKTVAHIKQIERQAEVDYIFEDAPQAFAETLEGVDRVRRIVQAMKNFSHSGRNSEKMLVDLNAALHDTLTVARNELKYVADVVTDFGDIPVVMACAGELNQVFLNLLVNAAHAIEDKGEERGVIRVQTRSLPDKVVVSISDTGCGIPGEIRRRIFDPFFTTKDVGRGSGQGLAIARNIIVDRHGGSIECDSQPGVGSTFCIRLAITPGPAVDESALDSAVGGSRLPSCSAS